MVRYRRCSKAKKKGKDIQKRRVTRKVYGKKVIQVDRQTI